MDFRELPLVSVVTPVYNGEAYLAECIESVLSQTYSNWEYLIVNNCSTDGTAAIVERYALMEKRIRVHRNDQLLPIIANHNRAFSLISSDSKYVKVVSGDDWIYPECLVRMVSLAMSHPSVGLVGSYQLAGGDDGDWHVRTDGLPYKSTFIPGRDISRSQLLGQLDVFGNPTSSLYRADIVRSSDEFYPNPTAEADVSACYKALQQSDFGFVHQVLSYERVHSSRVSAVSWDMNAYLSSKISDCVTYGPSCLSRNELESRLVSLLDQYYTFLANQWGAHKDKKFWDYHERRLAEVGYPLDRARLRKAIRIKRLNILSDPRLLVQKVVRRATRLSGLRSKDKN